eukprot:2785269-Amphidinium_carterae.1
MRWVRGRIVIGRISRGLAEKPFFERGEHRHGNGGKETEFLRAPPVRTVRGPNLSLLHLLLHMGRIDPRQSAPGSDDIEQDRRVHGLVLCPVVDFLPCGVQRATLVSWTSKRLAIVLKQMQPGLSASDHAAGKGVVAIFEIERALPLSSSSGNPLGPLRLNGVAYTAFQGGDRFTVLQVKRRQTTAT